MGVLGTDCRLGGMTRLNGPAFSASGETSARLSEAAKGHLCGDGEVTGDSPGDLQAASLAGYFSRLDLAVLPGRGRVPI